MEQKKLTNLNMKISKELKQKAEARAVSQEISLAAFCRLAIQEALKNDL